MMSEDLADEFNKLSKNMQSILKQFDDLIDKASTKRGELEKLLKQKLNEADFRGMDLDQIDSFLKHQYAIIPRGKGYPNEWWVITPLFTRFRIGYPDHTSNGWLYCLINKYMSLLGRVPPELEDQIHFNTPLDLKIFDGMLLTGEANQKEAWDRYNRFLTRKEGTDRIRIKKGSEFDLIAKIIEEEGMLPFAYKSVDPNDMKEPQVKFQLREYQKEWWDEFLKYGAICLTAPYGSGKSKFAEYPIASLKGRKLLVCPTRSLIAQWKERISSDILSKEDIDIVTYHSYDKVKENKYTLVVFDEVHRLPAQTFSRMSTILADYRLGLSGSPYREDGRTNFIFALSGKPLSPPWEEFFKQGIISKPIVKIHIFSNFHQKISKLDELIADPKKTIIYIWRIEVGENLSKRYGLPFVSGKTQEKDRLGIIRKSKQTIVSSVGSEGISITDLERVIEYEWLGSCYDDKTEVFTKTGWKLFKDINYEDYIGTRDIEGYLEFQHPDQIFMYDYKGMMIHFDGKSYDILVTPNHMIAVKPDWKENMILKEARDFLKLSLGGIIHYKFLKGLKWRGIDKSSINLPFPPPTEYAKERISQYNKAMELTKEGYDYYEIEEKTGIPNNTIYSWVNRRMNPNKLQHSKNLGSISIDNWLDYLGWYLSEGSSGGHIGWDIKISQTKEEMLPEIVEIFERLKLKPSCKNDGIYANSRQLATYCQIFGHAHEKFIPNEIKQLPSKRLERLLKTLMKGDGYGERKYFTTSKQLADDVQEIALKCGYSATIGKRSSTIAYIRERRINAIHTLYTVSLSKRIEPEIWKLPHTEYYEGKVYCVEVPNHVILVRRNGKVLWCGNSRREESQRIGRLHHSQLEKTEHIILMTEKEFQRDENRLYALYEHDYDINVVR